MLNVLGEGKAKCKSLLNFRFIFKCIHLGDNSILLLDWAISISIVSPVVVYSYWMHDFRVVHHPAFQFRQVHNWEILSSEICCIPSHGRSEESLSQGSMSHNQ